MKCRYCGQKIPEGMLYCENCGKEVRIVPDYNPLDDMLTAQIRGAINGDDDYIDYDSMNSQNTGRRNTASRNTGRQSGNARRNVTSRNTSQNVSRNTSRNNTSRNMSERERRRRQVERKKAMRRKKRKRILLIFLVLLIAFIGIGIGVYQTSYKGIVTKGYKSIESKEFDAAAGYFQKAINKNKEKPEAYTGLSKVYIEQKQLDKAEKVFLDAIEQQPKNADIYEACVNFYMDTDQKEEIPLLLEDADDSVTKLLAGYIVVGPEFSLDDDETFDDVQELSLSTEKGCTIYYTDDGSEPTVNSIKYSEPIQIGEDETVITAIAVNEKGIPSLPVKKNYLVELPIEDAPAVSPSTGQYETANQIEIKVPDGYEAYYTMDGTDPTTASKKYSGPINMPEGETIFKAILVNGKGRSSGVTTRNYVLEVE
ncbi:MAG: chitobiase/beta-hexosaminidase C-terminal domain-containing protein [Lachnospiraceae bacterium]|nr:chitobiase/beta-hexosaminidase C-terminal domain-containing protein [Lachnospiraceae bacterium]